MRNDDFQKLLDKQALHELMVRYCRAIDRRDAQLLLSVYHPDAIDDHGTFRGSPAAFVEYAGLGESSVGQQSSAFNSHCFRKQHAITNEHYEIDGDVAWGEVYVSVRAHGTPIDGAYSRMLDRYERRNGEWKIAKQLVVFDHIAPESGIAVSGTADRRDPSYRIAERRDLF